MRAKWNGCTPATRRNGLTLLVLVGALGTISQSRAAEHRTTVRDKETLAVGEELFHHEWLPNDSRSSRGDGLGPVYNDTSCVACHNLGGPGGAGPAHQNIVLLTAFSPHVLEPISQDTPRIPPDLEKVSPVLRSMYAYVKGENARLAQEAQERKASAPQEPSPVVKIRKGEKPSPSADTASPSIAKLVAAHPGFKTSRSVVLHRFGTDPGFGEWRTKMMGLHVQTSTSDRMRAAFPSIVFRGAQTRIGEFLVQASERNTTPLFGAGLIDALPEDVIEAAAGEGAHARDFPEIHGRVSRLKDGRVGRFGWKGQMASLADFVLNACAIELGLEVPDHPQASNPMAPDSRAQGLDLTVQECAALTEYVASLPAPVERRSSSMQEESLIDSGRTTFASLGCAACHRPKLGDVAGLYSDLLLHDMGPRLADTGSYGVNLPDSPEDGPPTLADAKRMGDRKAVVGAMRQEWRTPPLWGVRDSGPYLHDGRAATLEQAIALHGGEGERSAQRFFALTPCERSRLVTFLKTLVAPTRLIAQRDSR